MAATPSRNRYSAFITVIVATTPIVIAFLVAHMLVTTGLTANAPADELEMAHSVHQIWLWSALLGLSTMFVGLYLRATRIDASLMHMEYMLTALRQGDSATARRQAQALGPLSHDADYALSVFEQTSHSLRALSEAQRLSLDTANGTLFTLAQNVEAVHREVNEVSVALMEYRNSYQNIHDHADSLTRSAEESSSSVLEMVAVNNEVRENMHTLAFSVQETTSALEEMAFSSKEVAKNIEELSTAAEETAASMNQMDVSISQVESNANETSALSSNVTRDAEIGVSAIKQTIAGIDKIKASSRIAKDVIGNLGQKIDEIGNILNVIDDVAEQTNLLALNAAIIAAQAGEHGRGFAVVADEIKALAERTGASTKEIADLIKTIQDQSRNAIDVMSKGVDDVAEGVRLGHNAEDALRKIVESAKRSTLMIQAIAQATVEQAKGSKQVTNAISRIAETVQQIAFATAEQAKGSEHIMQSADKMRTITQQVERSVEEQNRGSRQLSNSIDNIRAMVEQISLAQRGQAKLSDNIAIVAREAHASSSKVVSACRDMQRWVGQAQANLTPVTPSRNSTGALEVPSANLS